MKRIVNYALQKVINMKMKRNSLRAFFLGIVLTVSNTLSAQVFPVNASVTVTPPYSPYLSDYVSVGSQKVMLSLSLRDLTVPEYACKLRLTIEGVGITIRTKTTFTPQQPFILPGGGAPVLIYGEELGAYFNPANLDFAGITRSDYEKGAKLPEGIYKVTIEALDYYRGTLVSNKGNATLWIILNDPPQLNLPRNESIVQLVNPANIVFNWTPRNTASPNASFTTEYIFRIVEVWPLNGNGYQAFLTQKPLYEVTTTAKQILYTDAEPALLPGRTYAWQVQAVDVDGKDLFKNQGKSEVYVFQFGELLENPIDLKQTAKSVTGITAAWSAPVTGQIPDQYRVRYAVEKDTIPTWYEKVTKERWTTIDALVADTSYRVEVRSEYLGQSSQYSAEVIMKTDSVGNTSYACGVETFKQDVNTIPPLKFLFSGDVFSYRNFKITVANFKGANGQYEGTGTMQVPFFSNASVKVKFSGEINEKRVMERGEVVSTYNKGSDIDKVIEDTKNIGKEKYYEKEERLDSADVILVTIAGVIKDVYINEDGEIVVNDSKGKELKTGYLLDSVKNAKDVKIIDDQGNVFVVHKDGSITNESTHNLSINANPAAEYYVVRKGSKRRYNQNETLVVDSQSRKITLSLKGCSQEQVPDLVWKSETLVLAKEQLFLELDVTSPRTIVLEIYQLSTLLFKMNVVVTKDPLVVFSRRESYNGEYGLDNKSIKNLVDANDYKLINGNYVVPVLSMRYSDFAVLHVQLVGPSQDSNNKDLQVTLRSQNADITLNNEQSTSYSYEELLVGAPLIVGCDNNELASDELIRIEALDHNQKLIGGIDVIGGRPYSRPLKFVYVKLKNKRGTPEFDNEKALSFLNANSHNHLLMNWEAAGVEEFEFDIENDAVLKNHVNKGEFDPKQAKHRIYANYELHSKKVMGVREQFNYVFIVDINCKVKDEDGVMRSVPGINSIGLNVCFLFNQRRIDVLAHELGHALNLQHTFEKALGDRYLPKFATDNFMDYSDSRSSFFVYQIRDVLKFLKRQ